MFCVAASSPLVASISVTGDAIGNLTVGKCCADCQLSFALSFGVIGCRGVELLPSASAIVLTLFFDVIA